MKFIDVTLRDGGHQHGFHWPLEFIERYLKSLNSFKEIEFVELGYWKQSGKFEGPFYSIGENLLSSICKMTKKKLSIMVDYHYCSHNVEDFPSTKYFNELGLIRVCLRKEDILDGCKFVKDLKEFTKCKVSINFFNITNYNEEDLALACKAAAGTGADFMYFADTHGGLDLGKNLKMFQSCTNMIKKIGMIPGLHLHDHSGKAYFISKSSKWFVLLMLQRTWKRFGKFKVRTCFDLRGREHILDHFILDRDLFKMPSGPYGVLTEDSITDHYAVGREQKHT